MTRREAWPSLGLALVMALSTAPALLAAGSAGIGGGYDILSELAVMDQGRIKPLDTLAIARVKAIHGRSTITLTDEKGHVLPSWGPVAALLDWSARPDFWNDAPFLLVEYLPLKRQLLASPIRAQLQRMTVQASPADRAVLETLLRQDEFQDTELKPALRLTSIPKESIAALNQLAVKLSGDNKYLSPNDLEQAALTVNDQPMSFVDWFREIMGQRETGGGATRSEMDNKVAEVGVRLFTYQALRDRNAQGYQGQDLDILPRPHSREYVAYAGAAEAIFSTSKNPEADLSPLAMDTLQALGKFLEDLPDEDRVIPGTGDTRFDTAFSNWLRLRSGWVPLRVVLQTDEDELVGAGFPAEKVRALRAAFVSLDNAESAAPGKLPIESARAVVSSARDLGVALGNYPSTSALARETHFNRFAPFYKAPMAYGLAMVLLFLSLGVEADRRSFAGRLGAGLYAAGMLGFVGGILLEVYGFYLRVRISGWAPVTNMYETVIWVALIAAVIGLVLELVSRKIYPALAASGVAMLTTVLAANVSLMDPAIGNLMPVLRSNYWLALHVLTIVSSYAAFTLALGLGLMAIGFYLTATYRGSSSARELLAPLGPGLPLLAVGALGLFGSYQGWIPAALAQGPVFYLTAAVAAAGGMLSIAAIYAGIGELANRRPSAAGELGLAVALIGTVGAVLGWRHAGPAALSLYPVQFASWVLAVVGVSWLLLGFFGRLARVTLQAAQARYALAVVDEEPASVAIARGERSAAIHGGGGVATLSRPSIDEIRERIENTPPRFDSRELAMQATAARIKPLSNFTYRAMQVGVILVTAGTILGGVWADKSWGRFWGWDPKEVWALITLLVYLVPLHGRFAGLINTFGLMVSSVVCFLSVLMAWYGVNFVLGVGLHSYGFTDGGGQGIVVACSLAVLAVVLGASWRRRLSNHLPAVG